MLFRSASIARCSASLRSRRARRARCCTSAASIIPGSIAAVSGKPCRPAASQLFSQDQVGGKEAQALIQRPGGVVVPEDVQLEAVRAAPARVPLQQRERPGSRGPAAGTPPESRSRTRRPRPSPRCRAARTTARPRPCCASASCRSNRKFCGVSWACGSSSRNSPSALACASGCGHSPLLTFSAAYCGAAWSRKRSNESAVIGLSSSMPPA